jgi:hypothetical protein
MKKFTVAGVSVCNGQTKVRFCSDRILRIKNLQKQGDECINLVDLPNEMTKDEACKYLLSLPEFKDFYYDISSTRDQKVLQSTKRDIIIDVPKVVEDAEINSIKEIVLA